MVGLARRIMHFDRVWGMPPFYAQQMAADNYLPLRVESRLENPGNTGHDLDVTATRSEDGSTLVLHVVNVGSEMQRATVTLKGFSPVAKMADVWTLRGTLQAINTPEWRMQVQSVPSHLQDAGQHFDIIIGPCLYTRRRGTFAADSCRGPMTIASGTCAALGEGVRGDDRGCLRSDGGQRRRDPGRSEQPVPVGRSLDAARVRTTCHL